MEADASSSNEGQESAAGLLDCLGPITDSDAPLTVEDCIEEISNDPLVQDVIQCVSEILPDADNPDSMLECEQPDNPCPSPTLDIDQMIVCGIPVCNTLILPDGCRLDPCPAGQIGINEECRTVTLCPIPTHVGVKIDGVGPCVPIPTEEPCDAPEVGIKPDCHTLSLCGSEEGVGIKVDGQGLCAELCPLPQVGLGSTCVDVVGLVLGVAGLVLGVVVGTALGGHANLRTTVCEALPPTPDLLGLEVDGQACIGDVLAIAGVEALPGFMTSEEEQCDGYQLHNGDPPTFSKVWIWDDDGPYNAAFDYSNPKPECLLHLPDEVSDAEYERPNAYIVAYYCPPEEQQAENPCAPTSGSVHVYHIQQIGAAIESSNYYAEFATVYQDGRPHECRHTHRDVCWYLGGDGGGNDDVVAVGSNRWFFSHADIDTIDGEGGHGGGVWYKPLD